MQTNHEADRQLINLVGAVSLGLSDAIADAFATAGAPDRSAAAALVALSELADAASVQALSTLIGISHSGAVRLVDRLTGEGLVQRRAGRDGRTHALTLTRSGRQRARGLREARRDAISAALASLSAEERQQLGDICHRVIATMVHDRLESRRDGRAPAGGALCRLCDPVACGRHLGLCPAANTAAAFVS